MQSIDLTINRKVDIQNSARVQQIASMFELPISLTSKCEWNLNFKLPESWHVGLIVGSSGSGKSTIANTLFSDDILVEFDWDDRKCVVDCFPSGMSIKDVIASMTSVGFSSPPCWLKPYHVLSNGEKFRVDMARAIAEAKDLLVVDEFTSVVDRQVAKIAANSVQKIVRKNNKQFVAVSCHFDIIDWLQPDWIYDTDRNTFTEQCLRQRPQLELKIYQGTKQDWQIFKKYHYMSAELHNAAQCFVAYIDNNLVGFIAYIHLMHPKVKDIKMVHRLVVSPDYQGLGIGGRLLDWLGDMLHRLKFRTHLTTTHPGMVRFGASSPKWKLVRSGLQSASGNTPTTKKEQRKHQNAFSAQRNSYTFCYKDLAKV